MQQPFSKIFLAGALAAIILISMHCTTNGTGKCEIDSLAVYNKYKNDHASSRDSAGNVASDSLKVTSDNRANRNIVPQNLSFNELNVELGPDVTSTGRHYNLKTLARNCVRIYDPIGQATPRTTSISFSQPDLDDWINAMAGADHINLELGNYDVAFLNAVKDLHDHPRVGSTIPYPDLNVGRFTNRVSVFLFAYNRDGSDFTGGSRSSAYNLGNLHP